MSRPGALPATKRFDPLGLTTAPVRCMTSDIARQEVTLNEVADFVRAGLIFSIATRTLGLLTSERRARPTMSKQGKMVGRIVLPCLGKNGI